ncbi:MAG: hypothetical protein ACLPY5_04140 [Candidatus Bathyarchaeia archaeon]
MPDVVRHKRFKNDVFWVSYNNPETDVKIDFLSIKFPEGQRLSAEAELSAQKVKGGFSKEEIGNSYETFVLASSRVLPLDTFKQIAAQGLTQASGMTVLPSNVSSPRKLFYDPTMCSNCNHMTFDNNPKFCPSCGKPLSGVPTFDSKTGVP